jgi:hypothetical protein
MRSSLFWSPVQLFERELQPSPSVEGGCTSIPSDPIVSDSSPGGSRAEDLQRVRAGDPQGIREQHRLTLALGDFAHETIDEEATRLGIPVEELVTFAVLYYLADIDSGRIARAVPTSLYPGITR